MVWIKWLGLVVATLGMLIAGIMAYGSWRWNKGATALLARVDATRVPRAVTRYDAGELEGLPAPVQRYFRAVLTDGQPIIAAAIEMAGTINLSTSAEQWKPFTSQQRVVTRRPGLLWNARRRAGPRRVHALFCRSGVVPDRTAA